MNKERDLRVVECADKIFRVQQFGIDYFGSKQDGWNNLRSFETLSRAKAYIRKDRMKKNKIRKSKEIVKIYE